MTPFATQATAQGLGDRLAATDRALADRLLLSASETAGNALRVLGQRLRAQVQGDADAAAAVQGVPNEEVAAALIAAGIALPDLGPLIADQFDTLADRWGVWVPAAFDDTAAVLATAATADDTDSDTAVEVLRDDQQARTDTGLAALIAGLGAWVIAEATGYSPGPQGEADALVRVPYGIVRDALAVTGGVATPGAQPLGLAGEIGPGSNVGGIATGPQALRAVRATGYTVASWTWHHGSPTNPFPPHSSLAGVSFSSWDDDQLINSGAFPPFSTYFPGDHRGCSCTAVPVFAPITEG